MSLLQIVVCIHPSRNAAVASQQQVSANEWLEKSVQNAIHIVGMKPRNMGVELGLIPSVTIKFVPA